MFLVGCPYSHGAEDLLKEKKLDYELILFSDDLNSNNAAKEYLDTLEKTYYVGKNDKGETVFEKRVFKDFFGKNETFPRIYHGGDLIGGYTQLENKLN